MLRPVLTIAFALFCQYAICSSYQHTDEKAEALQKLASLGINTTKIRLSVVDAVDGLCILEDANNKKFFIIANNKYKEVLDDRVLAYGIDSHFQGTESAWKKNLLAYYVEELNNLTKKTKNNQGIKGLRFEKSNSLEISPLIKTRWGQAFPYNSMCPKTSFSLSNKLTGCVATAMSQIMYYHKHPKNGTGSISIFVDGRNETVDFSKASFLWNRMKLSYSSYRRQEEDISSISSLMYLNALAVSSVFGDTGTSANNLAARTALVNFWNYHPTCQLVKSEDQNRLIDVIVDNLKRELPVIISGGFHSFICDGIKGDYLHFNLGWGGAANGYYKVKLSSHHSNGNLSLIKEVLYNIRPDQDAQSQKSVRLEKPGTLKTHLTNLETRTLRRLSISGYLGNEDIALLRQMSGASDRWNNDLGIYTSVEDLWSGCLQYLDIEEARIVKDEGKSYYCIKADGSSFKDYNKEYVFDESMNSERFAQFARTSMSHGKGYRYSQHDSIFYIEFFTEDNIISPMMFYDCQNLKEIKLPLSTKRIMGKAFGWCNSLIYVRIPYNTSSIESGAFEDCYLLEDIVVTKIPRETCYNLSPLKVDGKYGDKLNGYHLGLFNKNSVLTCKGIIMNGKLLESIPYKKIY